MLGCIDIVILWDTNMDVGTICCNINKGIIRLQGNL